MATNPVRNIQATSYDSPLDVNTIEPLEFLAGVPPAGDVPYLTVTIDWTPAGGSPGRGPAEELRRSEARNLPTPEGQSRRPGRTEAMAALRELLATLEPRSAAHDHLTADIAGIDAWLDTGLDPAAQGVYIVSAPDLFLPLALAVPIETAVHYGPFPLIRPLAHIAEDYATYAVLAVDQEIAELSYFTQGVRDTKVRLESTLYPRHQKQGALNQARYQRRAGERSAAFARAISDQVEHALTAFEFDVLVPVGSKVFLDELHGEFSEPVKSRLTEPVALHLNPWPSALDLAEATSATDLAAERAREAAAVAEVRELLGQNQAVSGTVDVLNALQNHQLWKLVMNEDFAATGWADPSLPLYGVGDVPTEHPLGGDVANIIPVDLAEAIIRLTLQTGGTVELVHTQVPMDAAEGVPSRGSDIPRAEPAAHLDDIGGIGAVLRYTT
jgi:hypothetical protein